PRHPNKLFPTDTCNPPFKRKAPQNKKTPIYHEPLITNELTFKPDEKHYYKTLITGYFKNTVNQLNAPETRQKT
ncbi:hypothetical protein, partial [Pseudomonas sp. PA-6-1H]|uniref:hypothetical protein n=1 Tax=Pseudomonas sp. PA-6-1H TaxID=2665482 RepID=UPI001F2AA4AC